MIRKGNRAYNYFRKLWTLTSTEKYILVKGLFLSWVFFIMVKLLPLRYYIHLLKSESGTNSVTVNLDADCKMITKNIARLEKVVLWPMTCLNKVLTARYLYKNLGIASVIQLSLFEDRSGKKCAHASLLIDGRLDYLPVHGNVRKILL